MPARRPRKPKAVASITHDAARRPNIPSAEHQPVMSDDDRKAIRVEWERRNPDLDPQLVWRGKAAHPDDANLAVDAPPLYIQERIHPKALIDDLMRVSSGRRTERQIDLFADFNGLPDARARTEFYQHHARWSNRMILGDSLRVMASLAEREGLRGKVQCIYLDPPYGIRFNSNFQWSATSRDVRDGKAEHITREPEQVRAFRDTWREGIHSYLSYLRDRLTVARDLLADSGSIFVQIGDENVHRVRALMDEVFGEENFVSLISFRKTTGKTTSLIPPVTDNLVWYARDKNSTKFRTLHLEKLPGEAGGTGYRYVETDSGERKSSGSNSSDDHAKVFAVTAMLSPGFANNTSVPYAYEGKIYDPGPARQWKAAMQGMDRIARANRFFPGGKTLNYVRYLGDFPANFLTNSWMDTWAAGYGEDKIYVVQTTQKVVQRCVLMTTDPGDLVLDPTCGSGTTAYVAEQWGRRWITVDTSRVALALARARMMGGRFAWYRVRGEGDGERGESGAGAAGRASPSTHRAPDLRLGFEYERVPHIQLRDIANNAEIDVIWEELQPGVEAALGGLNEALRGHGTPFAVETGARAGQAVDFRAPPGEGRRLPSGEEAPSNGLLEWEVPREAPADWPEGAAAALGELLARRRERQAAMDGSIARNAGYEELYDRPKAEAGIVRVAGPFTVESVSPHRTLTVDADGGFVDGVEEERAGWGQDFAGVILENLRVAGVRQARRGDAIVFSSLTEWPGRLVCAEGVWDEGGEERRAGVFIGPEFGTVSRPDLVEAAREAAEAGFDALIACAFAYDAHSTEFERLGAIRVLKARMNADLHMAGELKASGAGANNLFVIFGEPDVRVASGQWLVTGGGRMVAPYELVAELSGLGSLAALNGAGRDGLAAVGAVSERGAVRDDEPAAAGGGVGAGEHRGGGGAARDGGVPAVPGDRERIAGGDGDVPAAGGAAGAGPARGDGGGAGGGGGGWTAAERAEAIAALQALTDADFPLTTDHRTQVTVRGVDVYDPARGEVRSDGPEGIACWFIDTDYDGESFFVRHAYFPGTLGDPYQALRTTLKAEVDAEAWATLRRDVSRPFARPSTGRIAVKVINHLGDEAMKVYRVE